MSALSQEFKDGKRKIADGSRVQRYLCRDCGYRFTDPRIRQILKVRWGTVSNTAQRAVTKLVEVKEESEGSLQKRETTTDLKSLLFNYAWFLKKNGYAPSTIETRVKLLRQLAQRGADLYDPESVKDTIARQDSWSNARKELAVYAYTLFLKMTGGSWKPPAYIRVDKLPFIPYEKELDALIAGCSRPISAFLQLLKETGIRAGEAYNLRWKDVDPERRTVTIKPEKKSNPRVFNISEKLIGMLLELKNSGERSGGLFGYGSLDNLRRTFQRQRKRLAYKLKNPRLLRITFHTFRHWKATMLAHQTRDPFFVKDFMGHKNIMNTMRYIHLSKIIFKHKDNEFITKVARTVEEARKLIEAGFEKHDEFDGIHIYRKRK